MRKLLSIITFIIVITSAVNAQESCNFNIANDTTICDPGIINIKVTGNELDKIKWYGPNIISNDTDDIISALVDSTTTFYVINRISDPDNLITNGDFEMGNIEFQSDYNTSCINGKMPQGSYCISTVTDIYWPAWKPCSDHTTGTGNMYVTDGAVNTDEKIWCQTVNVNQNTDYEFSAWLTTVLNQENAILQFAINTDPIGVPFQASSIECKWSEFFQIWNSKMNTSAEICITNQNTASEGNDFALDDIKFNKVCYSKDSVTITVQPKIITKISEDTTICPGDNFIIKADVTYPNTYSYLWSTGEITPQISNNETGEFTLQVLSPEGCFSTDTMEVFRILDPISNLMNDTTICFTIFKELHLSAGSANFVIWNHSSGIDTSETLIVNEPGNYQVTLYNGDNCTVKDRIQVDDFCSTELFIPIAFTPNNDGLNDTFGAYSEETYNYELLIFNRWGQLVFSSTDLSNRWDGNNTPQGSYTYKLSYTLANRNSGVLEETRKIGNVILIR